MEFKDKLKQLRVDAGMTQEELGRRSGLHSTVISFYEAGTRKPGLENIISLCKGLECNPDELLDVDAK